MRIVFWRSRPEENDTVLIAFLVVILKSTKTSSIVKNAQKKSYCLLLTLIKLRLSLVYDSFISFNPCGVDERDCSKASKFAF